MLPIGTTHLLNHLTVGQLSSCVEGCLFYSGLFLKQNLWSPWFWSQPSHQTQTCSTWYIFIGFCWHGVGWRATNEASAEDRSVLKRPSISGSGFRPTQLTPTPLEMTHVMAKSQSTWAPNLFSHWSPKNVIVIDNICWSKCRKVKFG